MTLEARVKTVEAMECVDLRELRASLNAELFDFSASLPPCWAYSLRFLRITNHQTKNVMMATAATPPMTPPAMAPALLPLPDELSWESSELLLVEVWIHFVVAH